jgi:hypothetical protein
VFNTDVIVFNLDNPLDFGTFSLGGVFGLRAGARSPSFISAAIRFPSTNRDVRAGQKRFPGMMETDYTTGDIVAGTLSLMDDIGDALIGDWLSSVDAHVVCNYAIIARVCKTVDPVTGKCLQYRLPEIDGELTFYLPTSFVKNSEITTQNSRKVF